MKKCHVVRLTTAGDQNRQRGHRPPWQRRSRPAENQVEAAIGAERPPLVRAVWHPVVVGNEIDGMAT